MEKDELQTADSENEVNFIVAAGAHDGANCNFQTHSHKVA